jgi:hypothetical protein
MSCLLTQGFLDTCKDAVGGIKEIFMANQEDFESGVIVDPVTQVITALPTATIFRYKLSTKNGGSMQDEDVIDETARTKFSQQTLTFNLGTISAAKRKELETASRANPVVFVLDAMDNIHMLGRQEGCSVKTTTQTGATKGDLSGYAIEVTAEERFKAEMLAPFDRNAGEVPFENFVGITVSPGYGPTPIASS